MVKRDLPFKKVGKGASGAARTRIRSGEEIVGAIRSL